MSSDRGILIAIEGIDGAGKTTQVAMLADALVDAAQDVQVSKEPTEGEHGKRIRQSALNGRLPLDEELEAFVADRKEHVSNLIQPSLDAGKIVILDRYFYSTIAYQGSRGKDLSALKERMEAIAPVPDIVFLLDIDPTLSLYRIRASRGDVPNEFETLDNLNGVRDAFNRIADDRIERIDGSLSRDAVHRRIVESLIEGPLRRKRCAKKYGCDDPYHCGPRMLGDCEWWHIQSALRSRISEPTHR